MGWCYTFSVERAGAAAGEAVGAGVAVLASVADAVAGASPPGSGRSRAGRRTTTQLRAGVGSAEVTSGGGAGDGLGALSFLGIFAGTLTTTGLGGSAAGGGGGVLGMVISLPRRGSLRLRGAGAGSVAAGALRSVRAGVGAVGVARAVGAMGAARAGRALGGAVLPAARGLGLAVAPAPSPLWLPKTSSAVWSATWRTRSARSSTNAATFASISAWMLMFTVSIRTPSLSTSTA